jgi:hypothetical protein
VIVVDTSHALASVRRFVWSGLYDPDEVVIILSESWPGPGRLEVPWLRKEVKKEAARKQAEEATWPATTDCDRLDRAFATMEAAGLIVEQDAGLTKSDGLEIVTETYEDAVEEGEADGIVGYCYYHGQDLDRVMGSGELCLAFGDFDGDENRCVEVGRLVKRDLEDAGFEVQWSGSVHERILVRGIRWLRRGA